MLIAGKKTGPCIANRDDCIASMIKQHFGNNNVYERKSKEQVQEFIDEAIRIFFRSMTKNSKDKKKR